MYSTHAAEKSLVRQSKEQKLTYQILCSSIVRKRPSDQAPGRSPEWPFSIGYHDHTLPKPAAPSNFAKFHWWTKYVGGGTSMYMYICTRNGIWEKLANFVWIFYADLIWFKHTDILIYFFVLFLWFYFRKRFLTILFLWYYFCDIIFVILFLRYYFSIVVFF